MADFAHRRQHHWVLVGELIDRRDPVAGEELRQPVRGIELLFKQIRRPLVGVGLIAAWPHDVAEFAHFLIGGAVEVRAQMPQLIPDLLGIVVVHRIAHPGGDFADDLPVGFQVPLRLHGFKEALEAAVRCGIHAFVLAPRCGRQDDVGRGGGFGHENVLDDNQFQIVERFADRREFGIGLQRILTHDVRCPHFTVRRAMRQLADAIAGMFRQAVDAPGFGELLAVLREFDVLVARIGIRQRAHIAGPLDVVLAAYRVDADARLAEVAGEDRQAGQRPDRLHALIELGDTHAPQDGGGFGAGVHPGAGADLLGANPGDRFHRLRRIAFNDFAILLEALGTAGDEGFIVQILFNNHVANGVEQRDIRAVLQRNVHVGDARGFNFARVADDDFRPVAFGVNDVIRHDRVGIRRVITEDKHQIGVINLRDGITHGAVTDRLVQTCNRRAVSDASAAVDVIGTNNGAREFLHHIVGFITGAAGGAGGLDRIRAIFGFNGAEASGDVIQRLIPGDSFQLAAALTTDHGGFQARRQDLGIVNKVPAIIALQAQGSLVGFPLRRFSPNDFAVIDHQVDFAT